MLSEPDIFISYSREDRPIARLFADALGDEGFDVWWDAALHSGETFDEVIERNLRAAKAVVVLWSPRSVASRWVRAEATLADRRGRLAPAIIEACDRPIIFELTHTAELSHWAGDRNDNTWGQFVADLKRLVSENSVAESRIATKTVKATIPAAPEPAPQPSIEVPTPPVSEARAEPLFGGRTSSAFPRFTRQEPDEDDGSDQTQFFSHADSPFNQAEQHVLELLDEGEDADSYAIGPLGVRIGRTAPADVVLLDPRISRTHCEVVFANGEVVVSDLDSTNGTFVDDERIEGTVALPVGSILQVGGIRLVHEVRAPVAAR
ncbi:TIR domain-containing protein [Croceicoccus ponticola]|uniref:TIR domain-containing protein n=1 Tax=Croceicoccus ponticola TaxID=2217664 RepID=A0A437GX37_9SPHN|nr:TIR domain-containing protein [Croceicoccus ponticola]RVQ66950.1 TIR domain-containing protein [Croceicoccus ponticola]